MHSHGDGHISRRLIIGILLNSSFVAIELLAGIWAGSLALISDAGHNFSDSLALVLSLFALYISSKPATPQKTFGYHRAGILVALINALVLVLISAAIVYEAYNRIIHPVEISGIWLLAVAGVGFIINSSIAWSFKSHQHDLNVKSAFLHLFADAMVSLGVVLAGAIIMLFGYSILDPLISILISLVILYMAWDVIKESIDILLEAVPRKIDLEEVINSLKRIPGILDVHDIHIWTIGSNVFAMSCHALIDDQTVGNSSHLLETMQDLLEERFSIIHPTIQFECKACESGRICSIPQANRE